MRARSRLRSVEALRRRLSSYKRIHFAARRCGSSDLSLPACLPACCTPSSSNLLLSAANLSYLLSLTLGLSEEEEEEEEVGPPPLSPQP